MNGKRVSNGLKEMLAMRLEELALNIFTITILLHPQIPAVIQQTIPDMVGDV